MNQLYSPEPTLQGTFLYLPSTFFYLSRSYHLIHSTKAIHAWKLELTFKKRIKIVGIVADPSSNPELHLKRDGGNCWLVRKLMVGLSSIVDG